MKIKTHFEKHKTNRFSYNPDINLYNEGEDVIKEE